MTEAAHEFPDKSLGREVRIGFGQYSAYEDYRITLMGGPQDAIGVSLRKIAKADNPLIGAPEIRQHFCPLGLARRSPFAVNSDQRRAQFFRG